MTERLIHTQCIFSFAYIVSITTDIKISIYNNATLIYSIHVCYLRTFAVLIRALLMAKMAKTLPAVQETWVRSPGQEDPLEKEMATHSSILAWRIPWTEEPGEYMGLQKSPTQLSNQTTSLI